MAKANLKKGARLVCVPCGREVVVDCCGISNKTIWCCSKPMEKSSSSHAKSPAKKSRAKSAKKK